MIRSIQMIDLVLEKGADVHAMRPDGARPLDLTGGDYHYRGYRHVSPIAPTMASHSLFIGYLIARGAEYDIAVAAKVGDTERVRQLLERNPSLANTVPTYSTYGSGLPLRNACKANDLESVRVLLEFGADPSTPEPGIAPQGVRSTRSQDTTTWRSRGCCWSGVPTRMPPWSPQALACPRHELPRCDKLLASYGGEFPEHQDLADIEPEAMEAVYGQGLPLRYYVDMQDLEVVTARLNREPELAGEVLRLTLRRHGLPCKQLVRLCLDLDPATAKQVHANELLYRLRPMNAEYEWLEVFDWLLSAGMTPNDSDWLRVSSLHELAMGIPRHSPNGLVFKPFLKIMQLFIEAGADLDAKDEEYHSTPLGWAARWGRLEAAELLLERGARTNLPDDLPWATPLAWARKKGHDAVADLLVSKGATE